MLSSIEITALSDSERRFKRLGYGWLPLLEFATVLLCGMAVYAMILVDIGAAWEKGASYEGYIADPWRVVAVGL